MNSQSKRTLWVLLIAMMATLSVMLPSRGNAAITFVRSNGVTGGTSFSFDIGSAGNDRLVVVIAADESTGTNLSGVTVDGKACNLIVRADNPNGLGHHQEMWYCDEDNLGTSNGTVTVAISGGDTSWGVQAHLYTGVSQNGPSDFGIDNSSVNTTTVTVNGIDVPANGLVVMGAGEGQNFLTVNSWTSPLTLRQSLPGQPTNADLMSASGIESSAQTNKTYVATFSGIFNYGAGIVASFGEPGPCNFQNRKSITVQSGQVSGGPHANFPLLVSLTDYDLRPTAYGGDVTSSSGYDIIFRALDDTTCNVAGGGTNPCTLDHEIEFYDGTPDDVTLSDGWYTGTGPYAVPAGKNRLLVFVSGFENTVDRDITNVTFGGVSMTEAIGNVVTSAGYVARTEIWYLKDASIPASGSFAVTYSGGAPTNPMHAYALFTNVDQTTPVENTASNPTTTSDPVTATVNVVQGGMSIAGVTNGNNGTYTWGNGWTEGTDQTSGTTTTMSTAHHANAATGTDTASADFSGTLNRQVLVVASLRASGELVAWVRVPSINDGTVIYMYYGNSCVTSSTQNVNGVWGTSYVGVWHLEETSGTQYDSTSSGNHGTASVTTQGSATGKIDGADAFSVTTDYVQVGTSNWSASVGTVELWAYRTGSTATHYLFGHDNDPTTGYSNRIQLYYDDTTGQLDVGLGNNHTTQTNVQTMALNTWYHIILTWNGGTYKVYVNGVDRTTTGTYAGLTTLNTYANIGNNGDVSRNQGCLGIIDEVRVSNTVRSGGWVLTEYRNQNAPSTFYAVGTEEKAAPTAVTLKSFTANQYDDRVLLRWKTGYEIDNLGFHVYREENGQLVRLTPEPVGGSALLTGSRTALTAGHHYHWWDMSVISDQSSVISSPSSLATRHSPLATSKYWLEDIDLSGKRTMHGPAEMQLPGISDQLSVSENFRPELLSELGMRLQERYHHYWRVREVREKLKTKNVNRYTLFGKTNSDKANNDSRITSNKAASLASSPVGTLLKAEGGSSRQKADLLVQQFLAGRSAVKLFVREEGWYRVTQPELVAAGLNPRVRPGYLQLFVDGKEQPIRVIGQQDGRFGPRDAIEFYGVGLDTPSTDTRVYWLLKGAKPGKRIGKYKGKGGLIGSSSFLYTEERKDRVIYFPNLKNGDEENWFGPIVSSVPADQLLNVRHLDLAPSEDALLEVSIQGGTEGTHRVKVFLNDVEVGEVAFENQSKGFFEAEVPQALLHEGDNLVSLIAQNGETDISVIDSIRLTYWHTYTADEDALRFTAQGGSHLTVNGFSHSRIRVFDISDSKDVIEVIGKVISEGNGYAITFRVPESGSRTLLALTEGKIKSPEGVIANRPSSWCEGRNGADLVIIGYRDFLESLQPLKTLRESQGLKVALIDIEDLYDEFGFGNKGPKAIKDFLGLAKARWQSPPRFVLLVGDASFDPKNYYGFGDWDFLPTKLVDTGYMETASDDWFGDFNDDGLPEMAIGRLPVRSVEEANRVVSKIISYEQTGALKEAILVADMSEDSDDFDFEGASEEVRALLPAFIFVRKIYRSQFSGDDAAARGELIRDINGGPLLVNFIGHGSLEIWRGSILTSDDAENLSNTGLPFFVNMTCLNGFFQDPYAEPLGEALLKAPQGGAVAVWTSSGLTEPDKQTVMNKELIRLLFNGELLTLGEATVRAKTSVSDQDIRKTWILFGDPSQRLAR